MKPSVTNLNRLTTCERLKILGKILGLRHRGISDEGRDYPHTAREGLCDLSTYEVVAPIQAAAAGRIGRGEPFAADQGHDCRGRPQRLIDDFEKVLSRLDRVHIDKHVLPADVRLETISKAAGVGVCVLATVTNENRRHAQLHSMKRVPRWWRCILMSLDRKS